MTADNDKSLAIASMNQEIASVNSSGTTQTRFSFYNASTDFLSASSKEEGEQQGTRFHFYNAESVHQMENAISQEATSAEPNQQQQQQGRFQFYNSEALPQQKVKSPTSVKSPKVARASPREHRSRGRTSATAENLNVLTNTVPIAAVVAAVEAKSPSKQEAGKSSVPSKMDSIEILRSLQEHEQQRLNILGGSTPNQEERPRTPSSAHAGTSVASNPYEDAIKEALLLLRKHRSADRRPPALDTTSVEFISETHPDQQTSTASKHFQQYIKTPPEADRVLRSRDWGATPVGSSMFPSTPSEAGSLGEAYQAEIEARRKQRQERMARYASRLAELKQQEVEAPELPQQKAWAQANQNGNSPRVSSGPVASATSSKLTTEKEEEVQLGVERVLMAILDRANSRGRTAQASISEWGQEEKKSPSEEEEDALVRAMSDLLMTASGGGSVTLSDDDDRKHSKQQQQRSSKGDSSSHATQDSTTLAVALHDPNSSDSNISANPPVRVVKSDAGPEAHDELDRMVEKVFHEADENLDSRLRKLKSGDKLDEDTLDRRVRKVLSKDQNEDAAQQPHSDDEGSDVDDGDDDQESEEFESSWSDDENDSQTGHDETQGATETAADISYEDEAGHQRESSLLNGVLGPLSMLAGGSTRVVLENNSFGKASPPSILDSLSAAARSLVAGVSPPTSHQSDKYSVSYHSSGDSDSSESKESDSQMNDLMHTLCAHLLISALPPDKKKILLERIPRWEESNPDEPGYRIIRLTGEQLKLVEMEYQRVTTRLLQKERRKFLSGNVDESFERDLQEAENLLDREEQKRRGEPAVPDPRTHPWSREWDESECLAHFPGVRPAGCGEMGDLEYFNLPIIFKSHVTGFEPTKDLYMEAGNVVAGQYLVESELGSAAFSTAYRCIDLSSEGDGPDSHEEVCLKVIKNTKDFFDQSLDEIKILELLRQTGMCHQKNILEMKTFFYHREHLIIVTELLRQNLFEFGKFITDNDEQPYFTIPRLSYITRQTLVALEFVHSLGLVHSDVKPENILLASYSKARVKLIDFGSSCYLTDRQSSYIQSRSYRAPEVVLGLPYDGRIDIWSLGCVVAEMYTGEVTFQNDSVVSMLSRIEAICGPFPKRLMEQGRQSAVYYAKSGLLYEKVRAKPKKSKTKDDDCSSEEDSVEECPGETVHYDIFQPKRTTLAARLGFDEDLMKQYDAGLPLSREQKKQAIFVDFVRALLTVDPDKRPSAAEALKHPWMEYAASLSESDIRYP